MAIIKKVKKNPVSVSWIDSTFSNMQHFDASSSNWKKQKEKKKQKNSIYNFSEHMQYYEIFCKVNEHS